MTAPVYSNVHITKKFNLIWLQIYQTFICYNFKDNV